MFGQMEISVFPHLVIASQLSVGIVFLFSALPKLRRPWEFTQSVVEYRILPSDVAHVFAPAVVLVEVFLAIAFLTGWLTNIAEPLALGVLTAFLIAVGINLRRGRKISCGCFGDDKEPISTRTVVRLLLLMTAVLVLFASHNMRHAWMSGLTLMPADVFIYSYLLYTAGLAVFLILLVVWMLHFPELVLLIRASHARRPSFRKTTHATEGT